MWGLQTSDFYVPAVGLGVEEDQARMAEVMEDCCSLSL